MSDKPENPMDDLAARIDAAVDRIQEQMAETGRELSYLEKMLARVEAFERGEPGAATEMTGMSREERRQLILRSMPSARGRRYDA